MHHETKHPLNVKTLFCFISIAILLISLVPLFMIAKYDYPFGDDTLFSDPVVQAREADPSLKATLSAAAKVVSETRERWQGTFSAIFLMALQPGIVSPSFYRITPYLMIGALILSTALLLHTLLVRLLKSDQKTWLIIAAWTAFLSVQLTVSAREGFFWYNGAVYYTLYHCVLLVLVSLVLNLFLARRTGQKIALAVIGVLLVFFLSGGNYATAMVCGELLVLGLVYALAGKKRGGAAALAIMLAVYLAGMWISISAPGNALRQADVIASGYTPVGPVKAILLSLAFGAYFGLEWLDIVCFCLAAATAFAVMPALRKTQFRFRYPLIVLIVSFGVFASQFTPSAYAASSPGPYRLRNVAYFTFLLLVLFNTVYFAGWVVKKHPSLSLQLHSKPLQPADARRLCVFVAAVFLLALGAGLVQRGVETLPSVIAVTELKSGEAAAHARMRLNDINGIETDPDESADSQLLS